MKVLLTGGAGFIGSHLAEKLLEHGHGLAILDNFSDFYDPSIKMRNVARIRSRGDFPLYREDVRDREAVRRVFDREKPEAIVHLAACAGVRPSLENPVLYQEVNIVGTTHLLEFAREFEAQKFVFGSSSSVYGVNSKVPFSETDPVDRPISPYAVSKRAGELLCFSWHHNYGLPVSCLRFFTVYGPRQRPEMAIHRFTRQIDRDEEILVYHEGKSVRDYTYVDDIVQGILSALARCQGFDIFNLGSSHRVPLLELVRLIERCVGKSARVKLMPAQPGDVPLTYADISKAKNLLGYAPATRIEEGVPKFVEWYFGELKRSDSANGPVSEGTADAGRSMPRRYVILDCDGTVTVEREYLSDPNLVELLPGVLEGLRSLRRLGLGLLLVTNQSGVGRGYFDLDRLDSIHRRLKVLLDLGGITLDGIYFCPHLPADRCGCRKPKAGLVEQAAGDLKFDPRQSFVIGDKICDIQLGQRVGAATFLVTTGYGAETRTDPEARPDYVVADLVEAARRIEQLIRDEAAGTHDPV